MILLNYLFIFVFIFSFFQQRICATQGSSHIRRFLDSIALYDIHECEVDKEQHLKTQQIKENLTASYPCKRLYQKTRVTQVILQKHELPNTVFTLTIHNESVGSIIHVQIALLTNSQFQKNTPKIIIEDKESRRSFELNEIKVMGQTEWISLKFNGVFKIQSRIFTLHLIDCANSDYLEEGEELYLLFEGYSVWADNYFDEFQSDDNGQIVRNHKHFDLSNNSNENLKQNTFYPLEYNCVDGFEFNQSILQCIRIEQPCLADQIEVLKTKDCVKICPEGEYQFILQTNQRSYCTESYDSCEEPCLKCDISATICLKCKEGYAMQNNGKCLINQSLSNQIISQTAILRSQNDYLFQSLALLESFQQFPTDPSSFINPRFLYSGSSNRCLAFMNERNDCFKCQAPYAKVHGDCLLCPRGTYQATDKNSDSCQLIPIPGCSDLDTSSNCSACFLGYYLSGGACIQMSSCTSSQYLAIDTACHSCEVSYCSECYSATVCKTCMPGYYLSPSQGDTSNPYLICVSTCPSGYFVNSDNLCEACGFKCLTCTSSNVCSACFSGYEIDTYVNTSYPSRKKVCQIQYGNCYPGCSCVLSNQNIRYCQSCSSGYYQYSSYSYCYPCNPNCNKCTSYTTCTQCKGGITLTSNTCPLTCTAGKYIDSNSVCSSCNSQCSSCIGQDYCFTCQTGYISLGGQCKSCPNHCDTCSNQFACSTCSPGYALTVALKCVPGCLTNQYLLISTCTNCPTICATCTSGTVCTSCITGYSLNTILKSCQIICADPNYRDPLTNTCLPCPTECSQCSSATVCTSCVSGYSLNSSAHSCEIICSSLYFRNPLLNTCVSCGTGCAACSSGTACTTCSVNYGLLLSGACSLSSICGDGKTSLPMIISGVAVVKQCDDKNTLSGDGCSSTCKIEPGYTCTYNWTTYQSVCSRSTVKNSFTLDPQNNSKNNNPVIKVKFLYPLTQYSSSSLLQALVLDMNIQISTILNSSYSYIVTINSNNDELTLTFTLSVSAKNKMFTLTFTSPQFIQQNSLSSPTQTSDFPDYVVISQQAAAVSSAISSIGSAGSSSIIASILPIILFANFQLLFNALDLFQMIFYLQYLEIRLPFNIVAFIEIMSSFKVPFSTNFIEAILNKYPIRKTYIPSSFSDKDLEGVFLSNTGDSISQLMILGSIHLILRILARLFSAGQQACQKKTGQFLSKKLYESWEYGWYLDMYWDMYLSLVVGGILQLYDIQVYDFLSAVNIILTFLILGIALLSPLVFWRIIHKKKKNLEEERIKYKWGMLYESLRLEAEEKLSPIVISHPPKQQMYNQELSSLRSGSLNIVKRDQLTNLHVNIPSDEMKNQQEQQLSPQRFFVNSLVFDENKSLTQNSANKISNFLNEQESPLQTRTSIQNIIDSLNQQSYVTRIIKYYYVALYMRKMLFGVIIGSMTPYPYVQLILINLLNALLIIYQVIAKPYHSKFENFKGVFCEFLMVFAQTSFFFLIPDPDDQSESHRINIGWIFIACCSMILVLQFMFIFMTFIPQMKARLQQICCKKKNQVQVQPESLEQQKEELQQQIQQPISEDISFKKYPKLIVNNASNPGGQQKIFQDLKVPAGKEMRQSLSDRRAKRFQNQNSQSTSSNTQNIENPDINPYLLNPQLFPVKDQLKLNKSLQIQVPNSLDLPSFDEFNLSSSKNPPGQNDPSALLINLPSTRRTVKDISQYPSTKDNNNKQGQQDQQSQQKPKQSPMRIINKFFLDVPSTDINIMNQSKNSNKDDIRDTSGIHIQSSLGDQDNIIEQPIFNFSKELTMKSSSRSKKNF